MNDHVPPGKLTLLGIGGCLLLAITIPSFVRAQSSGTADWEQEAGGRMSFEVASVKRNNSGYPPIGPAPRSNFPLDSGDAYVSNGGLFTATNWPLYVYVGFAYKLSAYQLSALRREMPQWTSADHFDIQARAEGDPTKDQMRLMVQSLLEQRFKLAAHYETRQVSAYALVLANRGKLGSQLKPHSADLPCAVQNPSASPGTAMNGSIPFCGLLTGALESGHMLVTARNISMGQIATELVYGAGNFDRPVLDQTGIKGTFDLSFEFASATADGPRGGLQANQPEPQPDPTAPTFLEALKEELGLKLDPTTAPIDVLVIDHIEEPTPN